MTSMELFGWYLIAVGTAITVACSYVRWVVGPLDNAEPADGQLEEWARDIQDLNRRTP